MAQASNLAGITNTVGAPSFAFLAKGGNHEPMLSAVSVKRTNGCRLHHTRPCKERKSLP